MMQMNKNNTRLYTTPWGIPSQPKKVVSIPVHFVGSSDSQSTRNKSAMKIQKVARGFLVRNSMRRIKGIRVEVEQIERKVCDAETKELIKRKERERLKVSESIMNLLLKLDSIRVLDYYSGVRDCRKSVIKKAIALQEMVDQIQMLDPTYQGQPQLTTQAEDGGEEGKKMEGLREVEEEKLEKEDGEGVGEESVGTSMFEENCLVKEEEGCEDGRKMVDPTYQDQPQLTKAEEENKEMEEKEKEDGEDVGEESVGTSIDEENCLVKEEDEEGCEDGTGEGGGGDYVNNKSKELLERMIEDNERMMGMMAQLFERNEKQTRLLTSLSHRVEQLERAYACDKLRKKKRRNADAKHKQTHCI